MKQHHVQEAYLKNSAVNGKLWVFNKKTKTYSPKPASQCTTEEDFQSNQLEKLQNSTIESPGIQKLRTMTSNGILSEDDVTIIFYWTALHTIRNKNFRENFGLKYQFKFKELLNTEKLFTNYFSYISTYSCSENDSFITSDNPIIEFYVGKNIIRVLTLLPQKAILFSPIKGSPKPEIGFPEMVNSMYMLPRLMKSTATRKNYLSKNMSII